MGSDLNIKKVLQLPVSVTFLDQKGSSWHSVSNIFGSEGIQLTLLQKVFGSEGILLGVGTGGLHSLHMKYIVVLFVRSGSFLGYIILLQTLSICFVRFSTFFYMRLCQF